MQAQSLALFALFVSVALAQPLSLYLLQNATARNAVCNDGTPGGFWYRAGQNPMKWIIHLQGGAWCFDEASCTARAVGSPSLVSSTTWPKAIEPSGIFSANATLNPYFADASVVYVGYCSSDSWSGERSPGSQYIMPTWSFQARNILRALVEDLISDFSFETLAREVLFSGCSAGGQGVIASLDFVGSLMPRSVTHFRGMADAGWMMNMVPLSGLSIVSIQSQFALGHALWGGMGDSDCTAANPGFEWMCFISPYAAPYISTPLMMHTEQYDPWQTGTSCCQPPFAPSSPQSTWIAAYRDAVATSLTDVIKVPSGVFAGACYHHCITESEVFWQVEIEGITMATHLGKWFANQLTSESFSLIDNCLGFNCTVNCPAAPYS